LRRRRGLRLALGDQEQNLKPQRTPRAAKGAEKTIFFTCSPNFAINRDIEPQSSSPLKTTARPVAHFPAPAYGGQDTAFAGAFEILRKAIVARAFPAASLAITHRGQLIALRAFGRFTYDPDSPATQAGTIFDLASVSKVAATTAMAMLLYERGLLDLDAPVVAVVPEFARNDARCREVTFRMLLAHSSGLPAYVKLFLQAQTREQLLDAAFATPLEANPGTRAEYSDIGFIILGVALERIADEPLDRFCQREIFGPLGMAHTSFNPSAALRSAIPPTVDDLDFRHRIIQGEVQDENASVLGGVAGHAGVFSNAYDLAIFANAMLQGGPPIIRQETLAVFTRRQESPPGASRGLGWDTPSSPSQSGQYFSPRSFGHLGYTGTSLWIDPERQLSATLLTNRTWPDCSSQAIKEIRPRFHDAVVEALEAKP
jgi:serine-type D-Ala-D-Ala carboxypeptidase